MNQDDDQHKHRHKKLITKNIGIPILTRLKTNNDIRTRHGQKDLHPEPPGTGINLLYLHTRTKPT
jgi:ribosomal protein L39E